MLLEIISLQQQNCKFKKKNSLLMLLCQWWIFLIFLFCIHSYFILMFLIISFGIIQSIAAAIFFFHFYFSVPRDGIPVERSCDWETAWNFSCRSSLHPGKHPSNNKKYAILPASCIILFAIKSVLIVSLF